MKKILLFFLLFITIDVVFASEVYISKKDIDTGNYVMDCDFILIDQYGNVVDSWIQSDSYHVSNLENGLYDLISRPYIMGDFNDEMSVHYNLNVSNDILHFVVYNSKIDTPRNLGFNNLYLCGIIFIFLGSFILVCCKYSFF